jgi:hypothetical protein
VSGKRDYGCAAPAGAGFARCRIVQLRDGQWVWADLEGKGRRIRTVAVPVWIKHCINAWMAASDSEDGPLLRSIAKGGKVGRSLSDWAVWSVVEQSARQIGIEHSEPTICGVPARTFAGRATGI